jgi:predicted RNase H-like HicB family nuclease
VVEYETHRGKTIEDLLAEIDAAWQRLMATMTAHPEADYVTKRDAAGWTALDHLAHVTAWERSALFPLRRTSRHEALGITDEQFLMDFDPINALVRRQTTGESYASAMARARAVHAELVEAVRQADVEELWQPIRSLVSDTREQNRDIPYIELLMSDGCEHFDEHREFIEKILAG